MATATTTADDPSPADNTEILTVANLDALEVTALIDETTVRQVAAGQAAEITFDAFHVIQLANEALEQVRRAEVKSEPGLRHSRWIWLKDRSRWNMRQINQFHDLRRSRLKTTRAWHLKESLRELYACAADREHASILFNKWYQLARRCRLEPFKRLALTLKKHLQGVLNAFDSRLSNGRVEGINSLIQAAKARARGYRTSDNLITMAYLIAGKLVHLPTAPYRRAAKPSPASCWLTWLLPDRPAASWPWSVPAAVENPVL